MGRSRRVSLGLGLPVAVLAATLAAGCGGGSSHGAEGHGGEAAATLPPPTPDTTPIEALRTPAGLVLKIASPTTPSPSVTGAATASAAVTAMTPTPAK
jgi:hypothetical protein